MRPLCDSWSSYIRYDGNLACSNKPRWSYCFLACLITASETRSLPATNVEYLEAFHRKCDRHYSKDSVVWSHSSGEVAKRTSWSVVLTVNMKFRKLQKNNVRNTNKTWQLKQNNQSKCSNCPPWGHLYRRAASGLKTKSFVEIKPVPVVKHVKIWQYSRLPR